MTVKPSQKYRPWILTLAILLQIAVVVGIFFLVNARITAFMTDTFNWEWTPPSDDVSFIFYIFLFPLMAIIYCIVFATIFLTYAAPLSAIIWIGRYYIVRAIDTPKEMDYLAFLEGRLADTNGKYITDILGYNNYKLENQHNYIQRIFPTTEQSVHDQSIRPATETDLQAIIASETAKTNISHMYQRMLSFWQLNDDLYMDWDIKRAWNIAENHNYKRMTRVLTCLKALHMDTKYNDFCNKLRYIMQEPKCNMSQTTREIWLQIMQDSVTQ